MIRNIAHQLEMFHIKLRPHGRLIRVALLQVRVLLAGVVVSQRRCDLEGVADLAAVPPAIPSALLANWFMAKSIISLS